MEHEIDGKDLNSVIVILDALIGVLQKCETKSRERSLLLTKLEEAKMWGAAAWATDPE